MNDMGQPDVHEASGTADSTRHIRVRVFYQADPMGTIPGGVDTFIRGLIKWAPPDIHYSVVGMTTEPILRPVGCWTRCVMGQREFDFFPVFAFEDPAQRSSVPLTLRVMAGALRNFPALSRGFDVLELHRIEPLALFWRDRRPKNAFFHQDMSVLSSQAADIRWRAAPAAYRWMEDRFIPRLSSAWCVRETGVARMRARYPQLAPHIHFVPTWVDPEVFSPAADDAQRHQARARFRQHCGWPAQARVIVTVGRLDSQKDPLLLLDAFAQLQAAGPPLRLAYIGDGVLRKPLQARIQAEGLGDKVSLLGLRPASEIAALLRGADLFALSSAYEGMPMAALEALGSGLPVVTTDVGEVRKVVHPGCTGAVAGERTSAALADALLSVLSDLPRYSTAQCVAATDLYTPAKVLTPVYEAYRSLALGAQHTVRNFT